jgi:hypothetical protein
LLHSGDPTNNDDLDGNVGDLDLALTPTSQLRPSRRYHVRTSDSEGAAMIPPKHVTILGAGLTGLTTAYRLTTQLPQTKVTLIDSAQRVGGWIESSSIRISSRSSNGDDREKEKAAGEVITESGPRSIRPRGSPGAAGMLKLVRPVPMLFNIFDSAHSDWTPWLGLRSQRVQCIDARYVTWD